MSKNNQFDILENADDAIVDRLAQTALIPDDAKKRMFNMSKKKLSQMQRENNIRPVDETETEETVSGVEEYKPKWYRTVASAAACIAVLIGIAGAVVLLKKSGGSGVDEPPPVIQATVSTTSETTAYVSTSQITTSTSNHTTYTNSTFTTNSTSTLEAISTETFTEQTEPPTTAEVSETPAETEQTAANPEYPSIARELFEKITVFEKLSSSAVDYDFDVNADGYDGYYLVNNFPYNSVEEMREDLLNTMSASSVSRYSSLLDTDSPIYIDADGSVYIQPDPRGGLYTNLLYDTIEIISETDTSFTASVNFDNFGEVSKAVMECAYVNGKWIIDKIE